MKTGKGYSIEMRNKDVCNWAEPNKDKILGTPFEPGPGEKIVRVRIVKESDYQRLIKNQKAEK